MTSGSSFPFDATQGLLGPFLTMSDSDTVPKALPDPVLAFWLGEGYYVDIPEDERGLEWGEIAAHEIRYLRKRVKELESSIALVPAPTPSPSTDHLAHLLDLLEFGSLTAECDYNTRQTLEYLAQKIRGMIR